jgi:hypothetical protein
MPKSLEQIAQDAAVQVIDLAEREGYTCKPSRGLLAISDMSDLESRIAAWFKDHMEAEARSRAKATGPEQG